VIDLEGFIVRLAFSRLVDQKRIGDLEMAKRISNSCDSVGKNFKSVFVKKNNSQIFSKQKNFYRNSGTVKKF
jgi:hypothetical protein